MRLRTAPEDFGLTHVISLGAGVQSTTMLLMALHEYIMPLPKVAIFADTGWEPSAVYEHLEWLSEYSGRLGVPVVRVSAGNIRQASIEGIKNESRFVALPFYTKDDEGKVGKMSRYCTAEYKVQPIDQWEREHLLGLSKGQHAPSEPAIVQWIGISVDEYQRMKDSQLGWKKHRWPLIEHGMTRADCERWLIRHGFAIPPRSSCVGCPLHSPGHWRDMRDNHPAEWADAVAFDREIRKVPRMKHPTYLHRQVVPLDQVDLRTPEEMGQLAIWDRDEFNEECEGMCGV